MVSFEGPLALEEEWVEDKEDYSLMSFLPQNSILREKMNALRKAERFRVWARNVGLSILGLCYAAYFTTAMATMSSLQDEDYWCQGDGLLVVLTTMVAAGLFYFQVVKPAFGQYLCEKLLDPITLLATKLWHQRWVRVVVWMVLVVGLATFLLVDTIDDRRRLRSVLGVAVLLVLGFLFSTAPRKIRWRHIVWGLGLQFLLGLAILRWPTGQKTFKCAGDKVTTLITFTDKGSQFVFGDLVHPLGIMAFKSLTVILFFGFLLEVLFYWGVLQWLVMKVGWLLQVTIGTTACESVNAASNIFLGQASSALLIRPYLTLLTPSELHAVLTGGFSTVAAGIMALYISYGVDASHLLSASVMSAPAALAFAKLLYPETCVSKTNARDIAVIRSEDSSCLHAAMTGVANAISLLASVVANLIAFLAFVAFLDALVSWTWVLVGGTQGQLSLQLLFGWFFMPLAWTMGVDWAECNMVGELIGIKTIWDEVLAYARLQELVAANRISPRSEIISIYALCGFSNFSALGISVASLGVLAPSRKATLAKVAMRALMAGSAACFLTACVAGALISESTFRSPTLTNVTSAELVPIYNISGPW